MIRSYHQLTNICVLTIEKWSLMTRHWGQDVTDNAEIMCLSLQIMRQASDQSPVSSTRSSVDGHGRKHCYSSSAGGDDLMADV